MEEDLGRAFLPKRFLIGQEVITTIPHSTTCGGRVMEIPKGTKVIIAYSFKSESTEDQNLYTIINTASGVIIPKVTEI